MSLINLFKKKSKISLFTTPSHAQKFFIFSKFRQFYKYDISETDVHNPQKALQEAQERASNIYGTNSTYFLTNGSTSGIIASVLSCVKAGEKVLIWDNAHQCHKNAVRLAGAEHVFYEVKKEEDWGIYSKTSPKVIEKILKLNNAPSPLAGEDEFQHEPESVRNSGEGYIKAVIITSPTYEGVVSDIKSIKEVCKKYGAYLIIDEAHGALYPFCDKLPTSAIDSGADFVIQSLHKTAGGLNPTALLHCNIYLDIQTSLDLISTTSPSYPLLASIEKNINYLNSKKGQAKIIELIENIENMKKNVPNCEFYISGDSTKLLIKSPSLNGFELSEYLYSKGIEDERTNEKSTLLLCGIGTDLKKLKKLERVLKGLL